MVTSNLAILKHHKVRIHFFAAHLVLISILEYAILYKCLEYILPQFYRHYQFSSLWLLDCQNKNILIMTNNDLMFLVCNVTIGT